MKKYFLGILFLISAGCGSTERHSPKSEPFTGEISAQQLLADYSYFNDVYQQYQPSSVENAAAKSLSGKSILVLFGTWCHDSEREVPRLLKLLETSGVKLANLSIHGVNYNKQEPTNLHRQYTLRYTPTIILLDNEQELGRIEEKPKVSLGEDLASFVQ